MPNIVRFTELLFADQSLDRLLIPVDEEAESKKGAWNTLAIASENINKGNRDKAIELLLEIIAEPNVETRILLWSWTALRSLGVYPKSDVAKKSQGVVIQVPVNHGIDVLAAYADKTARYVNYSGKIIAWSLPDTIISNLIQKLLECSDVLSANNFSPLLGRHSAGSVRITILTCDGNRIIEIPIGSLNVSLISQILTLGGDLMANLINRGQTMNQLMRQDLIS